MGNDFISYLNSMNNADGNNINALAESQVTNKFYNHIRVDRKLGNFIVENINKRENACYIITGHAGDGKTSILVQILKNLNMLEEGHKLKEYEVKYSDGKILEYVKDMSELSQEQQISLLKSSLQAPSDGKSSILISNTGPLLNTFRKAINTSEEELDEIEDRLLKQLDKNECEPIIVKDYEFYLINIARIENLSFVKEIIEKICEDELWEECIDCKNKEKCPTYFNKLCISENNDRVINFIENYYRWLQENDKRITIRQMISQISYAFTGNMKCSDIMGYDLKKYNLFNYNFANLFFGYRGIRKMDEASQIKGIELIQDIGLDKCSLNEDYNIFVKGDFSYFSNLVRDIIEEIWNRFSTEVYISNENIENNILVEKQQQMRRAIRRFLLMYGLVENEQDYSKLYNQIYGEMYTEYKRATTESLTPRQLRGITRTIFEALYIQNIGIPPEGESNLYLTLTRNDNNSQNVLLLLAKAKEKDLEIKQVKKNIDIEDVENRYMLDLVIDRREHFQLTLPLLMHFSSVVSGKINTEINPSLSHGLAKLNTLLLRIFREDVYDEEVTTLSLIVNTTNGVKELEIEFDDRDKKIIIG